MLNRKRQAEGKLKINSKPVLRIMECPELGTVSGRCPGRTHLNRTAHPTLVYILATIVIAGAGFADCSRGRATARSGGAEVVVTRPSAALACKSAQLHQVAVSGAVNKSVTWKAKPATAGGGKWMGTVLD